MPRSALTFPRLLLPLLLPLTLLLATPPLKAQSFCSSDGQPRPLALLERFTSADCDTCWRDPATPQPAARELAIDWIVPGVRADDAPLAAAASREAADRLGALGLPPPGSASQARQPLVAAARTLRVAHGLPFNGYLGTSIELRPAGRAPWTAWLALVETIPAGTEGTPVERNLVRNLLQPTWSGGRPPSSAQVRRLLESRPMSIPAGAQPARLRVVGWVTDARGRVRAIAQSRCAPAAPAQ